MYTRTCVPSVERQGSSYKTYLKQRRMAYATLFHWLLSFLSMLGSDSRMMGSGLRRWIPKGLGLSLCAVPS
jgi:hypothetical protein